MKNYDTRVYSISDFLEWNNNNQLELSPDFQRRSVWSQKAKSYLIDTIIRGKPMPKIIIRQELSGSRTLRIVVDGQQRLRAILEFVDDNFKISPAHNKEFANHSYSMLPTDIQDAIKLYELGVDILFDMSYEDILDIFTRINTYTVPLNTQELRNAKYIGYFKQYATSFGNKYVSYFLDGRIMNRGRVARMAESELASELFVSLIGGVQTNKNTEQFYKRFEDEEGDLEVASQRFDNILSYIGSIYPPEEIALTNWSRIHLFYTLFTVIGHFLYGLKGPNPDFRIKITKKSVGQLRVQLDEISSKFSDFAKILDDGEDLEIPDDYREFIDLSRRRTTDTSARIGRTDFVCNKITSALN